jgi:hypothetical protein
MNWEGHEKGREWHILKSTTATACELKKDRIKEENKSRERKKQKKKRKERKKENISNTEN